MLTLTSEYGCSQLSFAVVQRDQYEVERLIRNGHNVNDTISPPFSPLCVAVGWNTGINILLKAGADPSTAVHCAIFSGDEVALQSLLDSGSCLEVTAYKSDEWKRTLWDINDFAHSLLSFALWQQRNHKKTHHAATTISILHSLTASRQRLMDLAKQYMSVSELKRCGWSNPFKDALVSDAVATTLATSIREKKTDVPPALWPSTRQSVYHDEWMTATAAEALFLAGFNQVDLPDEVGRTPLLVNAHFDGYNILERCACLYWFLHHGAEHVVFPHLNGKSVAHVIAANLGRSWYPNHPEHNIWTHFNKNMRKKAKACLPALLDRILSLSASSQRDNCQCFCSHSGCLPVHALLNHMKNRFFEWRRSKALWSTWHDEQIVLDLWSQCSAVNQEKDLERSEICRLQLFNRLGMRHTCCMLRDGKEQYSQNHNHSHLSPELDEMNSLEQAQFREEDTYAKSQLDSFMTLYHELKAEYRDHSDMFWNSWWTVLEEYVPSVSWASCHSDSRHVQYDDDLFPIEEHELQPRIDQIREGVKASIATRLQDVQEGEESDTSDESDESEGGEESEEGVESEQEKRHPESSVGDLIDMYRLQGINPIFKLSCQI